MRKLIGCVVTGCCLLTLARSAVAGDIKAAVDGNNDFAVALYKQLDKGNEGKNLFLSPYSISTAFAMTYMGARGETAKQMKNILHLPEMKDTPASFKDLQTSLSAVQQKGKVKLSTANAVWAQNGYKFLPSYLQVVSEDFSSELKQADFTRKDLREQARQDINGWVEGKTNDKIKELLKKGVLTPLTRMVLVNAIYFKGNWATQFKKENTVDRPFTKSDGSEVKVPTMFLKDSFRYLEDKNVQLLEIPYEGEDVSMMVVLPKKKDGLKALVGQLSTKQIRSWSSRLSERKILVFLPKFRVEFGLSLKKTLKAMGLELPFGMRADFSGMDGTKDLYIQDAIHKAFIEVDEKGTEAAAATAVIVGLKCEAVRRDPVFRADHPFLYLIRDNQTGSILFIGQLNTP